MFDIKKRKYLCYDGSMSPEKRRQAVDRFNTDDQYRIMLISNVGAAGLNLAAASVVILASPVWSGLESHQITGRCHRHGQTRDVVTYNVVATEGVDLALMGIAGGKSLISDDVMRSTEQLQQAFQTINAALQPTDSEEPEFQPAAVSTKPKATTLVDRKRKQSSANLPGEPDLEDDTESIPPKPAKRSKSGGSAKVNVPIDAATRKSAGPASKQVSNGSVGFKEFTPEGGSKASGSTVLAGREVPSSNAQLKWPKPKPKVMRATTLEQDGAGTSAASGLHTVEGRISERSGVQVVTDGITPAPAASASQGAGPAVKPGERNKKRTGFRASGTAAGVPQSQPPTASKPTNAIPPVLPAGKSETYTHTSGQRNHVGHASPGSVIKPAKRSATVHPTDAMVVTKSQQGVPPVASSARAGNNFQGHGGASEKPMPKPSQPPFVKRAEATHGHSGPPDQQHCHINVQATPSAPSTSRPRPSTTGSSTPKTVTQAVNQQQRNTGESQGMSSTGDPRLSLGAPAMTRKRTGFKTHGKNTASSIPSQATEAPKTRVPGHITLPSSSSSQRKVIRSAAAVASQDEDLVNLDDK